MLGSGFSSKFDEFDSENFCGRLCNLIERVYAFEEPSLNRASLPLFKFLLERFTIVPSSSSAVDESHKSLSQFGLIEKGLRIAWEFNPFDAEVNASFMWDKITSTRKNAWAVLSLIGDLAGGQKAILEIVRQVHKLRNREFVYRVEEQTEECEAEGFELWMIITRLLRDQFSNILHGELRRWLQIPWVCSRSRD